MEQPLTVPSSRAPHWLGVGGPVVVLLVALVAPTSARAGSGAALLKCARLDQSVCPALKAALADPKAAAPELTAALHAAGTSATLRARAGVALGILLGKDAAPALLAAAQKQPSGSAARIELLGAAARAGATGAAPELMQILGDGDTHARVIACGALAGLAHRPAAAKLTTLLLDAKNPRLQAAAANALAVVGDEASVPTLVALASAPDAFGPTRRAALLALAKLGPAAALTTAARLVDHPSRDIGRAALKVVAAAPARWTEPLVAFGLRTPGLRGEAALAAVQLKTLERAVLVSALALDLTASERTWLLHAVVQLKPLGAGMALMEVFGKLDDEARIDVLKALPALKDRTVIPALVRELERDRKPVANYVVYALENLSGERLGGSVAAWRKYAGLDKAPPSGAGSAGATGSAAGTDSMAGTGGAAAPGDRDAAAPPSP